jgi:hypothetical protein
MRQKLVIGDDDYAGEAEGRKEEEKMRRRKRRNKKPRQFMAEW